MASPNTYALLAPSKLAVELFRLERKGMFDESMSLLAEIWPDAANRPEVSALEPADAAEILLRCGSIAGVHGQNCGLSNPQEVSKNLLTEARGIFVRLNLTEKIADCENHLSLGYWRTGELNEAEVWVETALSHNLPDSCDARLYSYVIRSLVRLGKQEFDKICAELPSHETSFLQHGDSFLKGSFYNNYGVAVKNLGNLGRALGILEVARDHFLRSGNKVFIALSENNLSQIYKQLGNFAEAHSSIDRSTKLFRQIKDTTRTGFSLDTKAQIYLQQGMYTDALRSVNEGLRILRKSENAAYLTETMSTKMRILLILDDFAEATLCLSEAVEIARTRISEEAARKRIEEFRKALDDMFADRFTDTAFAKEKLTTNELKLVLPPEISQFEDYQGVWIRSSGLERFGIKKDSLAIVAKSTIKRGDLVAIRENTNLEVSCGLYDADFGMVCLEIQGSDPLLFSENEITILGKIVGSCVGDDAFGRMIVVPILNEEPQTKSKTV